jgi:hypothetical protein
MGAVIALSAVGMASLAAIGYYLPDVGAKTYWFISRSSGVVAYVLITAGVLWGLMQSGNLFRNHVSPLVTFGMHSFLSWLGLGFAALHAIILIGDGYIEIDLTRVFLPFVAEYRPIPVGLGIIGFYLMLLLTLSFYARSYLGHKSFRLLHYGSFIAFVMVTLHSLYAGTDSRPLWLLYTGSLAAVIALTVLRVISTSRARKARAQRPQPRSSTRPLAATATAVSAPSVPRQTSHSDRSVFPPTRRR